MLFPFASLGTAGWADHYTNNNAMRCYVYAASEQNQYSFIGLKIDVRSVNINNASNTTHWEI